jgi:hypothetical protein
MKQKPTPEEQVGALLDFISEEEDPLAAESLSAQTEEEVDAVLRAAGFDVEAENAKGQAEHEEAVRLLREREARERPVPLPRPVRPMRDPWYRRWGGAFAVAAAVELLGLAWTTGWPSQGALVGASSDAGPRATPLIRDAAEACAARAFPRCLAILDELDSRHPESAADAVVRGLREAAKAALGESKKEGD